ncbi:MAG TPA: glycosyltransferase family A protein [Sphingopyxis sp.]|nr:glycosyltransferase family A protein [Sphingopyxis sp.]
MRAVSIINAYYRNPEMLRRQFENLATMPDKIRRNVEYLVCDDCSPEMIEAPEANPGFDYKLFRITRKTPWNWMAARNVCAAHAKTDWLLFTDMDHLVPEETLRQVLKSTLSEWDVYRFSRVDAPDMTPYKPHPNSWLVSRRLFDRFVGFDERWAGCYGSDYDVRDRLTALANRVVTLKSPLVRIPREIVADASTTDFGRKASEFSVAKAERQETIRHEGGPPLTMSYPFERVA